MEQNKENSVQRTNWSWILCLQPLLPSILPYITSAQKEVFIPEIPAFATVPSIRSLIPPSIKKAIEEMEKRKKENQV